MTHIRDIILQRKDRQAEKADFQKIVKAYMLGIETTGDPRVVGRPGFVWVREYGYNGGVHQAFNPAAVRIGVNMPVLVGYSPREPWRWVVLAVDWELLVYNPDYDPNDPFLPLHALTHQWPDGDPGPDPVQIYPRAMAPLHVYPGTGMTIHIAPIRYESAGESVYYPGVTSYDISAYIPAAGNKVVILVYLDSLSNSEAVVAGDEVLDLLSIDLIYPDYPKLSIAAAYITLTDSHTQIIEADISSANQVLHMSYGTEDSAPYEATAVGQVLYSVDGVVFTAEQPVVDFGRWIADGPYLLVV